jgi:hypothetical protein
MSGGRFRASAWKEAFELEKLTFEQVPAQHSKDQRDSHAQAEKEDLRRDTLAGTCATAFLSESVRLPLIWSAVCQSVGFQR